MAPPKFKVRKKKSKNLENLDEEIESDSDDLLSLGKPESEDEQEIIETVRAKKIRLAKKYLGEIEKEEKERLQVDSVDSEALGNILREKVLDEAGFLKKNIADKYIGIQESNIRSLKNGHSSSVTCLVVSSDMRNVFTASKDASIVKWCFLTGKKLKVIPRGKKDTKTYIGHTTIINTLAINSSSKFLASGCNSFIINIWNPQDMSFVHKFIGHRKPINGLVFRKSSNILYSCSSDRCVKVWNLDEMCYVETLFGHQEGVNDIDCGIKERPVTCGGDGTMRIWKIAEESQLVFEDKRDSLDCVKYTDEQHIISGSCNGSLSLWLSSKRKPIYVLPEAHGKNLDQPYWIASVATYPNTDIIASGSGDGFIRIWKCNNNSIENKFNIPVVGFVNCIQFTNDGKYLVAGLGKEHRLGRWWNLKEAKNIVLIIPFLLDE